MEKSDASMAERREYSVSALSKIEKVMDYLLENPGSTFSELCENVDVPKSSLYQLMRALTSNRFVREDEEKRFHIGFRMFEYGQAAVRNLDIWKTAHPFLVELAKKTKLTVHLGILNENLNGVFLDRVDGANFTFTHTRIGAQIRLETSATGRALVAWESKKRQEQLLRMLHFDMESGPASSAEAYLAECERSVQRGYAVDAQASQPNINGIGVPLYNYTGEVCGAIAMGGLCQELDLENCQEQLKLIQEAAAQISAALGKQAMPV